MLTYWPILLIVFSNIFYHICTKSTPSEINPFASLTVTYLIGALVSLVLYFTLNRQGSLIAEFRHLNWVPFLLGVVIVGLEGGSIYMYKAGWNINTGYVLSSIMVAIGLVIVGFLLYHEAITWSKVLGIAICMVGLYFINK